MPVRCLTHHPAKTTSQASDSQRRPAYLRSGNCWQSHAVGCPCHLRSFAALRLTVAPVGDPLQLLDRIDHFGKVCQQHDIVFHVRADSVQHLKCRRRLRTDQHDKRPVPV